MRVANVAIVPYVCDSTYPSFKLTMDIRDTDTEDIISTHIAEYFRSFVNTFFIALPDFAVQALMDKYSHGAYSSMCTSAIGFPSPKCSKCSIDISSEKYIYNNNEYCLDCMYAIVVDLVVSQNLVDLVGINPDQYSSSYAIIDTFAWKRSVIDKYINAMIKLGVNPNIKHCIMTIL
jgi:hypothetical protein